MQKYKEYLDTKNEHMKIVHKRVNVEVVSDVLEGHTLDPCADFPAAKICSTL